MIPNGSDIKLLITTISDLVKKGMTVEAQEKIMDLREMLLDLREQNVDLRQENSELKKKIREEESVFFENGLYWQKKEDGAKDGPFCLPCRDNKGKLVRLTENENYYICPVKECGFVHGHTKSKQSTTVGTRGPRSWMGA